MAGVVTPFDDRVVLAAALEPDDDDVDTTAAGTGGAR